MNYGKMLKHKLVETEKSRKWLAEQMGYTSRSGMHKAINEKYPSVKVIKGSSKAFNMKPSELMALAEEID